MNRAADSRRHLFPPAATLAPAAAKGKKTKMISQAVAEDPNTSRSTWVAIRNGIASRAEPDSP
ncbi:MAG: hypothetical protein V9G09_08585 [Candidatus Nanopelagicales bacterium]